MPIKIAGGYQVDTMALKLIYLEAAHPTNSALQNKSSSLGHRQKLESK